MTDISKSYKPVSTLKVTIIVVSIVSILFPVLFAYINDEMNRKVLTRELTLTPLRLFGITLIVYGVIHVVNKTVATLTVKWLRYAIELPLIIFITYCWLLFALQYVDGPVFCGCTYPTDTWNFRQYIG